MLIFRSHLDQVRASKWTESWKELVPSFALEVTRAAQWSAKFSSLFQAPKRSFAPALRHNRLPTCRPLADNCRP
jgi:hypothetical protein